MILPFIARALALSLILTGPSLIASRLSSNPKKTQETSAVSNRLEEASIRSTVQTPPTTPSPSPTPHPTPTPILIASPSPVPSPIPTILPTQSPTPLPSPPPPPPGPTDEAIKLWYQQYSAHFGVDEVLLTHIAFCESRHNPSATNSIYAGLFQFSESTWIATRNAMGHDPDPQLRVNAEEAIKTAAFKLANGGANAWKNCLP